MKNNNQITCFADLEIEEKKIKKRIKKQEELIKIAIQKLPEELVIVGITKIISSVINDNTFKSIGSIIKTIYSIFSESDKENANSGNSLIVTVARILKEKLFH